MMTKEIISAEELEHLKIFEARVLTMLGDVLREQALQHKFLRETLFVPNSEQSMATEDEYTEGAEE